MAVGFFRPEAMAAIMRWREVLVGVGLAVLGLWWILGPGDLLALVGAGLVLVAGGLILIGIQRGRFRGPGGGAGAVQVDEGQITYFGPLTGGAVALREMERLTLDRAMYPPHWRLDQRGSPALLIPVNAAGADALFDAFATLPGLRTERMLSELSEDGRAAVVIWERTPLRPQAVRLH